MCRSNVNHFHIKTKHWTSKVANSQFFTDINIVKSTKIIVSFINCMINGQLHIISVDLSIDYVEKVMLSCVYFIEIPGFVRTVNKKTVNHGLMHIHMQKRIKAQLMPLYFNALESDTSCTFIS